MGENLKLLIHLKYSFFYINQIIIFVILINLIYYITI